MLVLAIIIVMSVGYAVAQMGMMRGGHMMSGMHDYAPANYNPSRFSEAMRISRGGQLYDDWWKATVDSEKPSKDHPLWKLQDTNRRTGYDTYRCKECHGWDYRGKDGAYGKGSHYTGFKGVLDASKKMSHKELEAVLKGAANKDHDFSGYLTIADISDLALFLNKGLADTARFVDGNGDPVHGNVNAGAYLFNANCTLMCHGNQGTMINFGNADKPEFVGTVASGNPWEFIHKVRSGQPGTKMPSAIMNGWTDREIRDVLAYARTLPADAAKGRQGSRMMGMMHSNGTYTGKTRGFGPLMR